jgi:hypothetical protein
LGVVERSLAVRQHHVAPFSYPKPLQ